MMRKIIINSIVHSIVYSWHVTIEINMRFTMELFANTHMGCDKNFEFDTPELK